MGHRSTGGLAETQGGGHTKPQASGKARVRWSPEKSRGKVICISFLSSHASVSRYHPVFPRAGDLAPERLR